MSTVHPQHLSATALPRVCAAFAAGVQRLHAAVRTLSSHLERRRIAAAAFRDFACMGDRDLHDIGIARSDVDRVAWGASDRGVRSLGSGDA